MEIDFNVDFDLYVRYNDNNYLIHIAFWQKNAVSIVQSMKKRLDRSLQLMLGNTLGKK